MDRLREQIGKSRPSRITELYAPQRELLLELFARFDELYRERKRAAGALDFTDLEECAVRLLEENREARERVQSQFDHILMDEHQDTNPQQARLIDLLRRPRRFFAVGDINQSIFGFRYAEPAAFRRFRDEANESGRALDLTGNFRSRAEILRAVETIADVAPGIEPRPLRPERKFETELPVCVEFACFQGADAATALTAEAQWVARRAAALGRKFRDIAVLTRNTAVIPEFAAAFEEAGVPYVVGSGRGFYECPEVRDLANLLRVIANPRAEIAFAATLRSPLVSVSVETLMRLRNADRKDNLASALTLLPRDAPGFDAADRARLLGFRERLEDWRARRELVRFDRLLLAALDDCGYTPESGARGAANIGKFLALARDASAGMSLDEFVEELSLLREEDPRENDSQPEESVDAVRMMTVHAAKGLEFPVVFLAAMHKGVEGKPPSMAFHPHVGLGAQWRDPSTRKGVDDLFERALREQLKARDEAEGNRLLYVAMTRAEERLILSCSGKGKLKNWAERVAGALELKVDEPRDEIVARVSPAGEEWKLRVVVEEAGALNGAQQGSGAGLVFNPPAAYQAAPPHRGAGGDGAERWERHGDGPECFCQLPTGLLPGSLSELPGGAPRRSRVGTERGRTGIASPCIASRYDGRRG